MKLWVKTLKGEKFEIEVDPSQKVREIKEHIQNLQGYEAAQQKLIAQGKVMTDDAALSDYNIKEGDFIVVMVQRSKPEQQQVPVQAVVQPTQPQVQQQQQQQQQQQTQIQPPVHQQTQTAQQQQATENFYDQSVNSLVTGQQFEQTVSNICEMGFPREQVIAALRAAYSNPDRAIEYLMNGIPQNAEMQTQQQQVQQPQSPAQQIPQQGQVSMEGQQGLGNDNPLTPLLNNPNFQQIKMMIQQNPQILPQVLEQIKQTNPQLFQIISENQQAFLQILNVPALPASLDPQSLQNLAGQIQNPMQIQVTEEEKAAIGRIVDMGFDRQLVVDAYIGCDKNEEATVNFLIETQMEEQVQLQQQQQLPQQDQPQQPQQQATQQIQPQQQIPEQQEQPQQAAEQQVQSQQIAEQQAQPSLEQPSEQQQQQQQEQQGNQESKQNENQQPPPS